MIMNLLALSVILVGLLLAAMRGLFVDRRPSRAGAIRRVGVAMTFVVSTVIGVVMPSVVPGAAALSLPQGSSYVAVIPVRLGDTRDGVKPAAGSETRVKVVVDGGDVPSDASAVWLNVTAVLPDAAGHLTVYPCGAERPNTANVNYTEGSVSPNAVLAKVGDDGEVCIWTYASAHIVTDLNGYVPADGSPTPLVPGRDYDSRSGAKRPAGSVTEVMVAGVHGVPGAAVAAMLNVTAVLPEAAGHLTVYPCGSERPNTANVNYTEGSVSPNAVLVGIGDGGNVCIWTYAAAHIVVDVMGFVPAGGTPRPIVPARDLDTRSALRPTAGSVTAVTVAGINGVSTSASAVMLNVTAVSPDGPGHLTVYPCGTPRTNTANVNYTTGSVSPNAVMSGVGTDGEVCIWTYAATDIVVDVMGYVPATNCTVGGVVVKSDLPATECDALIALYDDLDGPNWDYSTSELPGAPWMTMVDPCTWVGVACDGGHVDGLFVERLGMRGDVPSAIGDLTDLTELWVSNNRIASLPREIGSLTSLEVLAMNNNKLESLPDQIGSLESLHWLSLNDNRLTALPSSVGRLPKLNDLQLSNNKLTELPVEIGLLRSARVLRFDHNELSGDITEVFKPLMENETEPIRVGLAGNGCLTTTDPDLAQWLDDMEAQGEGVWNDGC